MGTEHNGNKKTNIRNMQQSSTIQSHPNSNTVMKIRLAVLELESASRRLKTLFSKSRSSFGLEGQSSGLGLLMGLENISRHVIMHVFINAIEKLKSI